MKKFLKTFAFAAISIFALESCEEVPAPYETPGNGSSDTPDISLLGDGTLANPYNVAAANDVTSNLQISNTSEAYYSDQVYVKGIISEIESIDTEQYGNATYYISDDGSTKDQLEVYRGKSLNGEKFKSQDEIKVGDTVIICGKLQNWLGKVYEFTTGSKIVYLNGISTETPDEPGTEEAKGDGTADNPFNVPGVNKFLDGDYEGKEVYFKGIITSFKAGEEPGNSYGNATFYISDDGKSSSEQFYVFRTKGFNGENFTHKDQLKVGDVVVIRSTVTIYEGYDGKVKETVSGKGVLISVNGKQEYSGGGSGEEPKPEVGTPEGEGTVANPWNVAAVNKMFEDKTYDTENEYCVKGIITNVGSYNSKYGSISYNISDDAAATNQFYIYSGLGLDKAKFTSQNDLHVGDEVVVCGKFTEYNGTFQFNYNSYLISYKDNGGGGDATGGDASSFSASDLGLENGAAFTEVTVNGVKIEVDGGGNNNSPKYYNSGTNLRMYPNNTLTLTAEKTISSIKLTCTSGYVASGDVATDKGDISVEDPIITISDINDKSFTLTNTSTTTGAASQVRIVKFDITYAE